MRMSESIANVATALCQFQGECPAPKKSAVNPHFKSNYSPLDEIISTITPHLTKNGLSQIQSTISEGENIGVKTILLHSSGEFIEFDTLWLPMGKVTAQGAGSSTTYARRYALCAALGIAAEEDDDGNAATENSNGSTAKPVSQKQVGLIKTQVKKLSVVRNVQESEVYKNLGFDDVTKLSSQQASKAIETLNKWVEQVENKGA